MPKFCSTSPAMVTSPYEVKSKTSVNEKKKQTNKKQTPNKQHKLTNNNNKVKLKTGKEMLTLLLIIS
jgi:hypothetical protein